MRVMCAGRVDLAFVLRAFLRGVDGVFIGGCRLGECNYVTHGNYHALNMVLLCRRLLEHIGLNPERLRIEFMSGADGILFAEVVADFNKRMAELGPLGRTEGLDRKELAARLEQITRLVPYLKLANREKLAARLGRAEEWEALFTLDEIDRLLSDVVAFHIDPEKCQACLTCLRRCPVDAIDGGKNRIHVIDQDKCIKCGTCYEVCPSRFSAVTKIAGGPLPPPLPEDARTIVRKRKPAAGKTPAAE
ncbi:MAG: hydrogenase iron-sulfur subunit [Desulfobacterales bacterium]|nr:hydrogenase iron-sulfur subunit [Desulfobacterales bacterium]